MAWRIRTHYKEKENEKLYVNTNLYFTKFEPYFKNLKFIQNK